MRSCERSASIATGLRPVLGALIMCSAVPAAIMAAGLAVVWLAPRAASLLALLTLSALTLVFVSLLVFEAGTRLAGLGCARRMSHVRIWGNWAPLVLVATAVWAAVLRPMEVTFQPSPSFPEIAYWELPTGSRIAYWKTSGGDSNLPPVVFLHGGPGAPDPWPPGRVTERLAALGFDVYHYHQLGSGLSSRLQDPSAYTLDRHIADLDAIRETLGAESFALVGGSWGGTLAAHYVARHPERVSRLILNSPGALWRTPSSSSVESGDSRDGSAADVITQAATARFGLVYMLARVNPKVAQQLASDEEMSGFMQPLVAQIIAGDVAAREGHSGPEPGEGREGRYPAGYGFYSMVVGGESVQQAPDPRPGLLGFPHPVLVLRGEDDRMSMALHCEYIATFPRAHLHEIEGVGHAVASSPHHAEALISFLLKEESTSEFVSDITPKCGTHEGYGSPWELHPWLWLTVPLAPEASGSMPNVTEWRGLDHRMVEASGSVCGDGPGAERFLELAAL